MMELPKDSIWRAKSSDLPMDQEFTDSPVPKSHKKFKQVVFDFQKICDEAKKLDQQAFLRRVYLQWDGKLVVEYTVGKPLA